MGTTNLEALQERKNSPFCPESNQNSAVVQPGVVDSNLVRGPVAFSGVFVVFVNRCREVLGYIVKDAMEFFFGIYTDHINSLRSRVQKFPA